MPQHTHTTTTLPATSWPRHRDVLVAQQCHGWDLGRFLVARFAQWPADDIITGIANGLVCRDEGPPLAATDLVNGREILRVFIPGLAPTEPPPPCPPVLYQDEHLIAIDKPSRLMMHPSGTRFAWALIGLAKQRWPHDDIDLIHRLDRDTSGVVLLSRDPEANRFLKRALHDDLVHKTYIARIRGIPAWDKTTFHGPIGRAQGPIRIQMTLTSEGKHATTTFQVIARDDVRRETLVYCWPRTGRTHQIRVHLAAMGHPILGDVLYGVAPDVLERDRMGEDMASRTGAQRLLLHARSILIPTPHGGQRIIKSPTPWALLYRPS